MAFPFILHYVGNASWNIPNNTSGYVCACSSHHHTANAAYSGFWVAFGAKAEGQTNIPALCLCICNTINPPAGRATQEGTISRHSSQPDRTRLLAVQPHPQGCQAGAAPREEPMPCDPSQPSTWCRACQFLPDPVSDILSQRQQSQMSSSGQAYPLVIRLFCEQGPGSAHSFPPHACYTRRPPEDRHLSGSSPHGAI